jgi:hypothetical protein
MTRTFRIALVGLSIASAAHAGDLNIVLGDCKLTSFDTRQQRWTTVPGEFQVLECDEGPGSLTCVLRTASEALPQTYTFHMDTALARVAYQGDSWGDVLYIDPVTHRAVLTSRLINLGSLGTKMCSGYVLDAEQFAKLRAEGAAKTKRRR